MKTDKQRIALTNLYYHATSIVRYASMLDASPAFPHIYENLLNDHLVKLVREWGAFAAPDRPTAEEVAKVIMQAQEEAQRGQENSVS